MKTIAAARPLTRRGFVAAGGAVALAGCVQAGAPVSTLLPDRPRLAPIRADREHLMKITVCLRPFRAAGPRLEIERFGEKTVVHNYGHGGSGWSLSWGCAEEATTLARSGGDSEFAVIGAGVIGLTTALRLVESGASVTIYANEFPAQASSARATGVWSPSSRIALGTQADDAFVERWKAWATHSYAQHQQMVGLADDPVEYVTQYNLPGGSNPRTRSSRSYFALDGQPRVIGPRWTTLQGSENPFGDGEVRSGPVMTFNVARYSDRLSRQFLLRGGKMIRTAFADRAAVLSLPEPVIVNCMGYGARAIWGDDSLVPVRGQINWLLPQPEAHYALYYDALSVISRRDGVVVQYLGPNDDWGYGLADETIDWQETDLALGSLRKLFG